MADDLLVMLADDPGRAAILLDVDGTLAPIVERPEDARVPDETRTELARLASRYALVACVSGRPGAEVDRLLDVPGVAIVGEHGLELAPEAARGPTRSPRSLGASTGRRSGNRSASPSTSVAQTTRRLPVRT